MRAPLDAFPTAVYQVFFCKWKNLLGLLRSITPAVAGAHGMFTRLKHALRQVCGRWVHLSPAVQDNLSVWSQCVQELVDRPTCLHDIYPFSPTWEGATDASETGMGGVCQDPGGQSFVWCYPFSMDTQAIIVTDMTINDLEITTLL